MNKALMGIAFSVVMLAGVNDVWARRAGAPAARSGSPASGGLTCQVCHGLLTGSGTVEILGSPAEYQLGELYDLVVRVADPVQLAAGFEISVEDDFGTHVGTLLLSDPANTRYADGNVNWVTHTSTGVNDAALNWASNGNSADYRLQWRAPLVDVGTITFWAAGNAINNNFNSGGDIIYATSTSAEPPGPLDPADLDQDGDVDLNDFATLSVCFGSTVAAPLPGCSPAEAAASDLDGDGVVDLDDFSTFAVAFGT